MRIRKMAANKNSFAQTLGHIITSIAFISSLAGEGIFMPENPKK
jgi:hypothetical protein